MSVQIDWSALAAPAGPRAATAWPLAVPCFLACARVVGYSLYLIIAG